MTDPKPVELTDTERAALMHHIGGWKFERQGLANAEDAFMTEVSRIVKARETAARREALLEAAQWFAHEDVDAFGTSRESAQTYTVLVLADEAQRPGGPRFALAEPERDEESGR